MPVFLSLFLDDEPILQNNDPTNLNDAFVVFDTTRSNEGIGRFL